MPTQHGKAEIANYTNVVIYIPNIPNISNLHYSIHITPIYNSPNTLRFPIQLQPSEIENQSFTVYSNGANVKFFWMVCYE